jgi:hypothetical protein
LLNESVSLYPLKKDFQMRSIVLIFAAVLFGFLQNLACSQDQLKLPGDVSQWFVNTDGSCVQCSISNCGVWQNKPEASTLLFNSPYGNRVRGGSGPSRVEAYSDARGIACWNITGDVCWDWHKWIAKTGRMAAIGYFGRHFQTQLWINPDPNDPKPYKVRNNWHGTTKTHYEHTKAEFEKYCRQSGLWLVVLKGNPPPPTGVRYVKWW